MQCYFLFLTAMYIHKYFLIIVINNIIVTKRQFHYTYLLGSFPYINVIKIII